MSRRSAEGAAARCSCAAKINLNLIICGRRSDGYHLIESEMVPIGVFDILTVQVHRGKRGVDLITKGGSVSAGPDNLVSRAAQLVLERAGVTARVEIELDKRIPVGAGLGGGSSDAAATLRVLNELLELGLATQLLHDWALELGADVPFFLAGEPAIVSGIGEEMSHLTSWPRDPLVVAFRGAGVSTAQVYSRFDAPLTSSGTGSSIPAFPTSLPHRRNDLEWAACQIDSGITKLKEDLSAYGASEVGMSGSGSAVFGFFRDEVAAQHCAERLRESGAWAEATRILAGPLPIERLDPELSE